MEACIELVRHTIKNAMTLTHIYLALLQIQMMQLGPGLPSLATLLFNQPTRGVMPIINRKLVSIDNGDKHCKALVKRQTKMIRNMILPEIILFLVQCHGAVVEKGDHNLHDCSYIV